MKISKKATAIIIALIMIASVSTGCTTEESAVKTTDASEKPIVISENTTIASDSTTIKSEETDAAFSKITNVKVGDIVQLGKYEQDNNTANGKESIAWKILAVENGKALLISEKILDSKPYNEKQRDTKWENCSLRKWLNNDFFVIAFTANEIAMIIETTVINKDNPEYGTLGGNNTNDKVFLLSIDEVKKYFANDNERMAKGTEFAKNNGLYVTDFSLYLDNCNWWLRSPGHSPNFDGYVIIVFDSGNVDLSDDVTYTRNGVRPALWINLQ